MKSFVVRLMGTALVSLVTVSSAGAGSLKTWDAVIDKPSRFKVLTASNSEAVLDKETGLVWQRNASNPDRSLDNARLDCYRAVIGGRQGWRLPTAPELASLLHPPSQSPALPPGHPFLNVQEDYYWTTTVPFPRSFPALVSTVDFTGTGGWVGYAADTEIHHVWCVRGPGAP